MARRKTPRKNEYKILPNCFQGDADQKGKWNAYFKNENPITLELGCGKADLSYGLAQKYTDRNYIGIDLKADRLWHPAKNALEAGIENIAFLCIHLLAIVDHFEENEIDEIWITFPDPFPKKRQAKNRMINPNFLKLYQQILKPGGRVYFKTDNIDLFQYSLEIFAREPHIRLHELTFDLHETEHIGEDAQIETHYERQFRAMGTKINYAVFSFMGS